MIADPRRHFVAQRTSEVNKLSRTPAELRPTIYMDEFLRPASDAVIRAARAEPSLESVRKRLDSWRGTLGAMLAAEPPNSFAPAPVGRRTSGPDE